MKNNQALALLMQLPMQSIRAKNAQKKRLAERTLMRMKMLCSLFKVESPGNENGSARYYDSVKGELDELFEKYPSEDNLQRAVEDSRWVKIESRRKSITRWVCVRKGQAALYLLRRTRGE